MKLNEIKLVDKVIIAQNDYGSKFETFYNSYETIKIINPPTTDISGIYHESILCSHCNKQFDLSIEYRLMALLTPEIITKMLYDKIGKKIINRLILRSLDLYTIFAVLGLFIVSFVSLLVFTTSNHFTFPLSNDKIIFLVALMVLIFSILINWIKYQKNKRRVNQGYALININNQIKFEYIKKISLEKRSIITSAFLGKLEQSKFVRIERNYANQGIGSHDHFLENIQQVVDDNKFKEIVCLKNNPWLS
jgi:hypothetical protein